MCRAKNFSDVPNVEELSSSLPAGISSLRKTPPGFGEEAGVSVLQPSDGRRMAAVLQRALLLNLTARVNVYFPLHHNGNKVEKPVQLHF